MTIARTTAQVCAGTVVVVLAGLWWSRLEIATALVDRKLAAAAVPASYRITHVGPFLERMEDVRIGGGGQPDLVAKRIDVTIGYGLGGPTVTGVIVDGARLRGVLDEGGLHFGAIDRLIPKSGGGAARLPDLGVTVRDSSLALATPNGDVTVHLVGSGNPARRFQGWAVVDAKALRLASCALTGTRARLAIATEGGQPNVQGAIAIDATACPNVRLGKGVAQVAASSNATFEKVALRAGVDGFGGTAGVTRFAALHGPIEAAGKLGSLAVNARLGLDHFGAPLMAHRVGQTGRLPAGLPITPTFTRAAVGLSRLLSDARAEAQVHATIDGRQVAVRVQSASLVSANGSKLSLVERGGLMWSAAGWRFDGDAVLGGGDLPNVKLAIRQPRVGAVLTGEGELSPYRAADAQIALPHLRFSWDGKETRFAARARVDGPLGAGAVAGLELPIEGRLTEGGVLVLGDGCRPVAIRSLRLIGFTFGPAQVRLCGAPLLMRSAAGSLRVAATTGPIHLSGASGSGAPIVLDAAHARLSEQAFEVGDIAASLAESHVKIARLDGRLSARVGGSYSGAEGAIARVPLDLSNGDGAWAFADGRLTLSGQLRIADAAASPRFHPLVADDMRLSLKDGTIEANATLREPRSRAAIVDAALTHRLSTATGHATLGVPGIIFAPKNLQPEALTPLTVGVIANAAGTVAGEGAIDWSDKGVSSHGRFGTEKLDLAAAFGPVSGIKGQVDFTDLLGLVSAPHQEMAIAEINPGVAIANGVVHFRLIAGNRVAIEDAIWPFASGTLSLEPTTLDFGAEAERRLTFRVKNLDAAAFVQQLDFPNLAAKGRFDGVLPTIFDSRGGRIEGGRLEAQKGGGTLAYVGELSSAEIGTMGKLAFDALKAIRYSALEIRFDGRLDGEMVSQVNFTGVREATPEQSLITRMIRNLPFRFNIRIRAPFRGLIGSARAYMDPRLLLNQTTATPPEPGVQPPASGGVR